jgi:hypothetical protein
MTFKEGIAKQSDLRIGIVAWGGCLDVERQAGEGCLRSPSVTPPAYPPTLYGGSRSHHLQPS